MNIQDRAEYDTLFEQLCAAMGAVPTDARRNGYWKGLAQMSIIQFGRVVERFAGDIRMAERRRVCLELADWIDGSKAEDMLPTLEECKAAFAGSMGRLKDQPEARLDAAEVFYGVAFHG